MGVEQEFTEVVTGASAEADVTGVSGFSISGAVEAIRQATAAGDLDTAKRVARLQVEAAKQSWEWTRRLLARLEELEAPPQAPAVPPVEDRRRRLQEARAAPDQEGGLRSWVWAYADALAAGDMEACEEIVRAPVGLLRDNQALAGLVGDGTEALARGRWRDAMPLLRFLVSAMHEDGAGTAPERANLAALMVAVGRIELLDLDQPEQARHSFKKAHDVAPEDGLPLAALSLLHHAAGEYGDGLAKAQRAVELTPERPDGHVALGMCAEGQGLPEAAGFYDQAVQLVWTRPEPDAALRGLRAPVPETLLHRLADHASRHGHPQLALDAIEQAIAAAEAKEWGAARWLVEANLLELKSRVLEALDRPAEAAGALRESGDRHVWAEDAGAAVPLLNRALDIERAIGEEQAETYWLLSNALRMLGYESTPPYINDNAVASEQMWQEGVRLLPPGDGPAWVFNHHAVLNELLSRQTDANRWERLWEAVTDFERSLLRRVSEAWAYGFLARCYRSLYLSAPSLAAVEQSLLRDPDSVAALEERVVVLANSGRFEEALAALEPVENRLWADGVRAFCYAKTDRGEAALALIDDVLARSESPAPWLYQVRAESHRALGRPGDARAVYELIWSRYDRRDREDQLAYAWAAFYTGRYAECLSVLEPSRHDLAERGEQQRLSGLCRLALGDRGGEEDLNAGIDAVPNARVLDDFLAYDLPLLEELLAGGQPPDAALAAVADGARRRAADRLERLRQPATAEQELAAVVAGAPPGERSWAWIGAQAGLARLAREQGRFRDAGRAYRLLAGSGWFEEAEIGLERVIEEVREAADQALGDGQVEQAVAGLRLGLSLAAALSPQPAVTRAALHGRLGLALLETGDDRGAVGQLERSLHWYATAGWQDPGAALGELATTQVGDAGRLWTVVDAWSALIERPDTDRELRRALTVALRTLMGYLDAALDDNLDGGRRFEPVVLPIVLELHETLVPPDTGPTGTLLGTLVPELRQRVLDQTGVRVPGIRVRQGQDLPPGGYAVLLDEVPVLRGRVDLADRFCLLTPNTLRALGFPLEEVRVVRDPITGAQCCWLPEAQAKRLAEPVRETLLDPLAFVVRHLEGVLRRHLAAFLGVQEVEELLEQWMNDPFGPYRITLALPDRPARLRFARLLRELARARVPVTDWRRLLQVAQGPPLADPDLDAALRALRSRVRDLLPGNGPSVHRFSLPEEWEQAIAEHEAAWRWELALHGPDHLDHYLQSVESYIAGQEGPCALVVRGPELRPLVRALLDRRNLPDLVVLAADELLAEELPPVLPAGAGQPSAG